MNATVDMMLFDIAGLVSLPLGIPNSGIVPQTGSDSDPQKLPLCSN